MPGTVVVTGSGGRIGVILRQALAGKYSLRGIDRVPTPGMAGALVASLTDLDAILPAFKGADAVVHLAADPRHTPEIWWDTLIPDNVVATANVYEAARRGGVKRVVFFSSMHVCGMYESDPPWSRIAAGDCAGLDPEHGAAGDRRHAGPPRRAVRREQDLRRGAGPVLRGGARDGGGGGAAGDGGAGRTGPAATRAASCRG